MTVRAFLVEDNPKIRENLTATLEELAPVRVVGFAEDESAATMWLASNPGGCDLVIIDVFLKRGSGLGVLRDSAGLEGVMKVVTSNYSTDEIRLRCLVLGADRFFDKSTELEELVDFCSRIDRDRSGYLH